jgi:hypothetical protein
MVTTPDELVGQVPDDGPDGDAGAVAGNGDGDDRPAAGFAAPAAGVATGLRRGTGRLLTWRHAHLLTLAAGFAVLMVHNRNQWFWGDEWAFVADRGPGLADMHLLQPHNEHWSTLPLLVYWALLSTVGLASYLPYAAVVVVAHLGLTHLLWRACLRAGARPAIATGVATVFVVLGAGAENLLWAFQMGFVAAVAFGWAAVLLHDHDGPFGRRDVAGWGASVAALTCSGPALVMVGVATLTVALRRHRWRDTLLTAAVPAVVFLGWWAAEGRHAETGVGTSSEDEWRLVDWAWTGLAHAAETVVGIPETGGLLVLALLAWWALHLDQANGRRALAAASAVGALAFYLMTGTGRVGIGMESALASRYVYVAAALLLPTVALAVSQAVPETVAASVFVLVVCALVAFHNLGLLRDETSREMGYERRLRHVVMTSADELRAGGQPEWSDWVLRFNPNLSPQDLRRIDGYGWLPSS